MTIDISTLKNWPVAESLEGAAAAIRRHARNLLGHGQDAQASFRAMAQHYETPHDEEFLAAMDVPEMQLAEAEIMSRALAAAFDDLAGQLRGLEADRSYCVEQAASLAGSIDAVARDLDAGANQKLLTILERLMAREESLRAEVEDVERRFTAALQEYSVALTRISYHGPMNTVAPADADTSTSRSSMSLREQLDGTEVVSIGDSTVSAESPMPWWPNLSETNYEYWVYTYDIPGQGIVEAIGTPLSGFEAYFVGSEWRQNHCHRSDNGAGSQLAAQLGVTSINVACSGATLNEAQKPNPHNYGERAQIDQAFPERTFREGVVYLCFGANDIGFANVLSDVLLSEANSDTETVAKAQRFIEESYQEELLATIVLIKDRAPNMTVVVAGYGTFFSQPEPGSTEGMRSHDFFALDIVCNEVGGCIDAGIGEATVAEQSLWNDQTRALNSEIEQAAEATNSIYLDPNPALDGHRFGDEDPYIYGLAFDLNLGNTNTDPLPLGMNTAHYTREAYAGEAELALKELEGR
ncbi:MAG: GDSL-type esterase/lipase family protein [Arachnia sp.]